MMAVTFAQMGFGATVTACSATPTSDGYVGTFDGNPYHVHPSATPGPWAALEAAITAGQVTIIPYVAPVLAAPTPAELIAYAQAKQASIASGGVSVNVGVFGASPVMLEAATDTDGKADLSGLLQASSLNPSGTFNWIQGTSPIALTQTQVQTLAVGVYAFVQLTWTVLGEVLAGITAGTITTTAQIDDPTTIGLPAWPVNS